MIANARSMGIESRPLSGASQVRTALIAVATLSTLASSASVYPHSLSYFNEAAGGANNGRSHLFHSAIDWGQDLLYLKQWLAAHPAAHPMHLAYYGYYEPRDLGLASRPAPDDSALRSRDLLSGLPERGWYAVSATLLGGTSGRPVSPGSCSYLHHVRPSASAGYSIYILYVTPADLAAIRQELTD